MAATTRLFTTHRTDLILSLGLCLSLFLLSRTAYASLQSIRDDNRINPVPDEPPEFFNSTTEDTINETTIETLANSPNPDMSSAAQRMLVDRILRHRNAYSKLLANARGEHGRELQEQGLVTLKYLYLNAQQQMPKREEFWETLVMAMRQYLPDVKERVDGGADLGAAWRLRSQGERDGLLLLGYELDSYATEIIRGTNLVRVWLTHYPLRQRMVHDIINGKTDDDLLSRVLSSLNRVPMGRKHLRGAGLLGSAITEADMNADADTAIMSMTPPYVDDATNVMMPPESPVLDPLNSNEDAEARLRRRRRNAVVFEDDTDTPEEDESPSYSQPPN